MRVIHFNSTGSTNAEARKLAGESDFGPLWINADEQTSGRGRSGRDWISPLGNLYASHLFPTYKPVGELGYYSFVAALAVYDCLSELCPQGDFGLKWPNDCLLEESKISGVLLETGKTYQQSWVVIGIGINLVNHPESTPYPATSLAAHINDVPGPAYVLQVLEAKMMDWRRKYENSGFGVIRESWLSRARNIPGPVSVRLPKETFEGQAIGMAENGALQVRLTNGTIRDVHAGDVFLGNHHVTGD